MSKHIVDRLSIRIDNKLGSILPNETSIPNLLRVHAELRKENEKAYEPQVVSIGPYHHGKNDLQEMENYKLLSLKQLLDGRTDISVDTFVMAMRALEESARKCYADTISLSTDDFVEIMILDGCFIIEFLRKLKSEKLEKKRPGDSILQLDHVGKLISRDLILLENQLPFFILAHLFDMTGNVGEEPDDIMDLALGFLDSIELKSKGISAKDVKHLLHLVHFCWCYSFTEICPSSNTRNPLKWKLEFIKSTTELQESGIKLRQAKERSSFLDIRFENGVLKIPPLDVDDHTECVFRNLIAYEQYGQRPQPRYVTDYMTFMDRLINSAKDVAILRHNRIINNWLGDDEAISTMFNKLGNNVEVEVDLFCYKDVFDNVNKHCGRGWNIHLASLRHNYFNSPWSTISFVAAALLILLTLLQTIFSALSYWKPNQKAG